MCCKGLPSGYLQARQVKKKRERNVCGSFTRLASNRHWFAALFRASAFITHVHLLFIK